MSDIKRKNEMKMKRKKRNIFSIALFIICFALLITVNLYNDVSANELTREISKTKKNIEQIESEMIKVNVQLDTKTNLVNVEQRAINELGLLKIEKYQIEYINLPVENKIETIVKEKNNNFFSQIARGFSVILEFLS